MPRELLLTTRQKIKIRNDFANKMWTDIELSKAQISKTIQSGGFVGDLLGKLAGRLMKGAVPLAKNVFVPLATMASAIDGAIYV